MIKILLYFFASYIMLHSIYMVNGLKVFSFPKGNLSFTNRSDSFITYKPWNASTFTALIFSFASSNHQNGLIFFVGDTMNPYKATNYMYLMLDGGKLNLVTQIHYFTDVEEVKIEKNIISGNDLNDNKWHTVEVTRLGVKTQLIVDGGMFGRSELGEGRNVLKVGLLLYVGGIPRKYSTAVCEEIDMFQTFIGCIGGLYGSRGYRRYTPLNVVERASSVKDGCTNACKDVICENNGQCVNLFERHTCDCTGTGFYGTLCQTAANKFAFGGYAKRQWQSDPPQTLFNSKLQLRFNTKTKNANPLAKIGGACTELEGKKSEENSFLILRFRDNGKLEILFQPRGGHSVNIPIDQSRILNDGNWHSLELEKKNRDLVVKIDRSVVLERIIPGNNDDRSYRLPNCVAVGKGFIGLMQQVCYNSEDVLKTDGTAVIC